MKQYTGGNGQVVVIRVMTDSHLANAIRYFERRLKEYEEALEAGYRAEAMLTGEQALYDIGRDLNDLEVDHDEAEQILEALEGERERRRNELQPAARISHQELHAIDKPVSTGGGDEAGTK